MFEGITVVSQTDVHLLLGGCFLITISSTMFNISFMFASHRADSNLLIVE
ncbi:hypothetical protein HOF65_08330 [bacterium]|jgi:hypothetical protein|nr:hypothetical protein [bacterium]MBT5492190.1 hypothetical protein [bacterium]